MTYTKKRYLTYTAITLFCMVLPFITINGNHMLLLSFDKMQFHFLGFAFAIQELYLMPFLLIILFIGIFLSTTMGGRIWCGWACPQTIFRVLFRDLVESKLFKLRRIKNKQKEIDYESYGNQAKKLLAMGLFFLLLLFIASNFMWYFVPPEDFFVYLQNPMEHLFLILFTITVAVFLFYTVVLTKEDFCVYFCPYSRVQSVLYDDNTVHVIYDEKRGATECTSCDACVKICPTHIDIKKGLQVECINCLECADACTGVMAKEGKSSLIQWSSSNQMVHNKPTNHFSVRNIMYAVSIAACIGFILFFSAQKEYLLVNVNRTTNLYKIEDKLVRNNYVFTIQNTQDRAYTYDIHVKNEFFEAKRFKPFTLQPNQRVKKVVTIETTKPMSYSNSKDTPLTLNVSVFAQQEPQKVVLNKKVAFIYPRDSLIK
ncbi:cytochrome c oxidase accessory protein CcoG [Candidatus Marinarcus aquaticus]|uniref:Cytochrome c oxidase accessory protein CcoG n=1 Tax=Candidatus Marinarcus aquaticus TaxID=2044504 RepID=A0A4Q0XQZ4_9BACT|nr:cytochrome c oxidase accessory protein CcoG [Candidatus Marinarcus aquaticus]RXJ58038.1 cytochrome c oxidase accessory protein CcoG [Candidatus Marinarcus aquaticus]